ncbi:hypothetical protein [Nocardia sp. NPDC004711]
MAGRYQQVSDESDGAHRYQCYDVEDDDDLIAEIARLVRDLYVDPEQTLASLTQAASDLDTVVSADSLDQLLDDIRQAVIPQINPDATKIHLETPRNEVAEILAYDALKTIHNVVIPASRIKEKEVPGQPTRGLDIFGLWMHPKMRSVICEVKASSARESPPKVVSGGGDSMHDQIKARVGSKKKLLEELTWSLKHADLSMKPHVAKAMIVLTQTSSPPPIAVPILVRAAGTYGKNDYGCFKTNPDEYKPADILFIILRLPSSIEEFADKVYKHARDVA